MASQPQRPRGNRLVLGIAGRIGAGKTSAGKYLASRYGFQYLRYSHVLAEWSAKDPETRARLQEVGWEVMAGGMQVELNHRLVALIDTQADAAVDGLRHPIDYQSLTKSFPSSFHLLYIESSREERWARLASHRRYQTVEAFERADSHPVEQQIESLRAKADLVLTNDRSLREFYVAIDTTIRKFKEEGHR